MKTLNIAGAAALCSALLLGFTAQAAQAANVTITITPPKGFEIIGYVNNQPVLNCGQPTPQAATYTQCSASAPVGSSVMVLYQTSGSMKGVTWGGDCASFASAQECDLTASKNMTVTATALTAIPMNKATLTFSGTTGPGQGTITATGAATTSCSATCVIPATEDLLILTPTVAVGWLFDHWTGDCSTFGLQCRLDMRAAHATTAVFKKVATATVTITPVKNVAVVGTFANKPILQCGQPSSSSVSYTQCSAVVSVGSSVTFSASSSVPTVKSFTWSGDCASAGSAAECTLTASKNLTVSATPK